MMVYNTLQKLKEMKLKGMSKGLEDQLAMPKSLSLSLSFDERFRLLVDHEDITRKNARLVSRLKTAKLREDACIENIDFSGSRGIDKSVIFGFTSGDWIRRALFLTQNLIAKLGVRLQARQTAPGRGGGGFIDIVKDDDESTGRVLNFSHRDIGGS